VRAVVVGLGWGRVHVAALREAGVEVVALCARDARAAEAAADGLGVPLGLAGLDRVSDLAADLISVAVPADQHARVIAELPASVPILCEKPAVGLSAPVVLSPGRVAPVWVNYAFAFLEAAALASSAVGALGRVGAVRADSRYDLGVDSRTELGMFFELVVHPWSWLVTLLGAAPGQASAGWAGPALHDDPGMAEPAGTDRDEAVVAIDMACGEVEGRLSCGRRPGMSGIAHEAVIEAARGRVRVGGRYRIGEPWSFRVDVDRGAG
jgi:predicted dehydrogenase